MDLNQAEVAVTTQHLIDMGQEKDNLLQMSDFGDMGEFLCNLLRTVPRRGNSGIQVHEMGGNPGPAHQPGMAVSQLLRDKGGDGTAGGTRQGLLLRLV